MNNTLALFDFDGTITNKDSMFDFLKYSSSKNTYYLGLVKLSPILLAYLLKIVPNGVAKERLLCHFFSGMRAIEFHSIADKYALEKIDNITRKSAMNAIDWHKSKGHRVVVVTASIECWIKKWCEKNDIELIGTRLEIIDGKITGLFSTKNCNGPEKVRRIEERYPLVEYEFIYAYGDSYGDKQMLEVANQKHYRLFS